jgi:hypothetical protein
VGGVGSRPDQTRPDGMGSRNDEIVGVDRREIEFPQFMPKSVELCGGISDFRMSNLALRQ